MVKMERLMDLKKLMMLALAVLFIAGLVSPYLPLQAMHDDDSGVDTRLSLVSSRVQFASRVQFVGSNRLELGGAVISLASPPRVADGYVDVVVSLDSNDGILGFLFNVVFDEARLTPVAVTYGCDFEDLRLVLPTLGDRAHSNRFIFHANGESVSHEVGVVATLRFRVNDVLGDGLPIAFGKFLVMADDGYGWMETVSVSTGYDFPLHVEAPVGLEIQGRGMMPFQSHMDITADFECPYFLMFVREAIGVFDRSIYCVDVGHLCCCLFFICCCQSDSFSNVTSLAGIEHFGYIGMLSIMETQLADLDLTSSNMRYLTWLNAGDNHLTTLDVRNTPNMSVMLVVNNYMLDPDCIIGRHYMINPDIWFMHGPMPSTFREVSMTDITADFECPNFLAAVRELTGVFDQPLYNMDIFALEDRSVLDFSGRGITSLAGIEHFRVIHELDVSNNYLTELNLPRRYTRSLHWLDASNNQLTGLNISHIRYWNNIAIDVRYNYLASPGSVVHCPLLFPSTQQFNFYPQNAIENIELGTSPAWLCQPAL